MTNHLLQKLISFQTVTADVEINLHALQFVQKMLKKKQIASTIEEIGGRPILLWGAHPNIATTLIMTHIDVVPALSKQFHSHTIGHILHGRGSADTKAAVAILASLGRKHVQAAMSRKILFCITTDEEVGGNSAKHFIQQQLPHLQFGIFLEPTNLSVVHQSKGIMQLEVCATGVPAHGCQPWKGENAIEKLTRAVEDISHLNSAQSDDTSTITCTKIEGGETINQVPASASAWFDVRIHPHDDSQNILEKIQRVIGTCALRIIKQEPALNTDPKNPHVTTFMKAVTIGGGKQELRFEPAASDARHCMQRHIPAVVFGPTGGDLHGNTEWVDIASLEIVRKTLITFITNRVQ